MENIFGSNFLSFSRNFLVNLTFSGIYGAKIALNMSFYYLEKLNGKRFQKSTFWTKYFCPPTPMSYRHYRFFS